MPTPIIEPMRVCELEAGNPKYQVPRFRRIAATSSAKTIANPALLPTCRISSTGSNEIIPEGHDSCRGDDAQEIEEAAPHHRNVRIEGMRINDGGHGVGGIVESVYEFKSQRHEQRQA